MDIGHLLGIGARVVQRERRHLAQDGTEDAGHGNDADLEDSEANRRQRPPDGRAQAFERVELALAALRADVGDGRHARPRLVRPRPSPALP